MAKLQCRTFPDDIYEKLVKRVWINYKYYMPTHQLSAIVEAAFATGVLKLEG